MLVFKMWRIVEEGLNWVNIMEFNLEEWYTSVLTWQRTRPWVAVNCNTPSITGVFSLLFSCLRLSILFNVGLALATVSSCTANLTKGFFLGQHAYCFGAKTIWRICETFQLLCCKQHYVVWVARKFLKSPWGTCAGWREKFHFYPTVSFIKFIIRNTYLLNDLYVGTNINNSLCRVPFHCCCWRNVKWFPCLHSLM